VYNARAGRKGNMAEDLKKAAWYLRRRVEKEEGRETAKQPPEFSEKKG
jgi:hypothetical protein